MRNIVFSYLVFPLIVGLSFSLNAASGTTVTDPVGTSTVPVAVDESTSARSTKIDLNSADALTLQKELNGIGKAKAEAIVSYREANGPFASLDELMEIKGVGSELLKRNLDKLTVE